MVNAEIGTGRVVAAIHRAQLEPGDSGRPTADEAVAVLVVDIMGAAMLVAMLAAIVTASVFSGSSTTLHGSDAAALVANS